MNRALSREDLQEKINNHPELIPISTRVLYQAAMVRGDAHLSMLAGFLAEALNRCDDPDRLDEVEYILDALGDLTRLHIDVLGAVSRTPPAAGGGSWNTGLLCQDTGLTEAYVHSAIARLVASGLVIDRGIDGGEIDGENPGGQMVELSDVGRDALEVLADARGAAPEDSL